MKKSIKKIHPLCYLLLFAATSAIYSIINQSPADAVDVTTRFDESIPFLKIFVVPYLLWYPFIYGLLIYYCFKDRQRYYVSLSSIVAGKLICFVIYVCWQSTVPRPEVVGTDMFAELMRMVYSHDQPVNCLPSIHVLTTFILMIAVNSRKEDFKREHAFVTTFGWLIILSTMFTKQHAILDVLAGILLACIMYALMQHAFRILPELNMRGMKAEPLKKKMKP